MTTILVHTTKEELARKIHEEFSHFIGTWPRLITAIAEKFQLNMQNNAARQDTIAALNQLFEEGKLVCAGFRTIADLSRSGDMNQIQPRFFLI